MALWSHTKALLARDTSILYTARAPENTTTKVRL